MVRHPSDHEGHGLRLQEASVEAAYGGTQLMMGDTSDSQEVDRVAMKNALEGQLGTSQHRHLDQKQLTRALVVLVALALEGMQADHCTL